MRKCAILLAALLSACQSAPISTASAPLGVKSVTPAAQKNGTCLSIADNVWSQLKNACVQVSAVADLNFRDGAGRAVYVIFSEDKQQAEVFSVRLSQPTLFDVVKGGYQSADGQFYLQNTASGWRLSTR